MKFFIQGALGLVMTLTLANFAWAQQQQAPQTTASTGANQTATNEQTTDYLMGGISATAGGVTIAKECPIAMNPAETTPTAKFLCFAVGPSGILAAGMDLAKGSSRQGAIDATNPDFNTSNGGDSGASAAQQAAQAAFNDALQTAQKYGINPMDPSSMAAANSQLQAAGMDPSTPPSGFSTPADLQAAVDKAVSNFKDKFSVSGVAVEGGGMYARRHHHSAGSSLDLASLLGAGNAGGRDPASVDGLQKKFGGDSIGVAEDNIFKQVSRRYQTLIAAQSFLPAPQPAALKKFLRK